MWNSNWSFALSNICEAIAAIIGDILFLLQLKEIELYWGAVVLRLEEEYWFS